MVVRRLRTGGSIGVQAVFRVTQADPNAPHGVAMSALRRTLASVLLMCNIFRQKCLIVLKWSVLAYRQSHLLQIRQH